MIVRRVFPEADAAFDTNADDARAQLARLYPPPRPDRSLRVNLVLTVDGAMQGAGGASSDRLSSPVDRRILGAIRSTADAVLIGAETLRREGHLLPRRTPLVILTRSGDLGAATVDPGREHGPIMVAGPASAGSRADETFPVAHEFVPLDDGVDSGTPLPTLLDVLDERGFSHLVCEGGAAIVHGFLRHGLVDELCLTTSPQLGEADGTRLLPPDGGSAELVQLLVDEAGYCYARRRLRRV